MGLDMHLFKETYIGGNYEHNNVQGEINLTIGCDNIPVNVKLNRLSSIREEVAYWRKANAIHQWFVDNVQGGVDNCGTYWASREKLGELKRLCWEVIYHPVKADKLLPTQGGFFFGETSYDDWYWKNIKYTLDVLEKLLDEEGDGEFYYHASW